jgi:hypothetical protein
VPPDHDHDPPPPLFPPPLNTLCACGPAMPCHAPPPLPCAPVCVQAPAWVRQQVEAPLVGAGLAAPGFVDSVALNAYHDGSEGIQARTAPRYPLCPLAVLLQQRSLRLVCSLYGQGIKLSWQVDRATFTRCMRRFFARPPSACICAPILSTPLPTNKTHTHTPPTFPPTPAHTARTYTQTPPPNAPLPFAESFRRRRPLLAAHSVAAPLQRQPTQLRHSAVRVRGARGAALHCAKPQPAQRPLVLPVCLTLQASPLQP